MSNFHRVFRELFLLKYCWLYWTEVCSRPREIGAQLRAPLKPPEHHSTMVSRGFGGALNWTPILMRGVRLSVSRCNFFFLSENIGNNQFFIWCVFRISISLHALWFWFTANSFLKYRKKLPLSYMCGEKTPSYMCGV